MTSILRLSKDRSSFLFRRQNQDNQVGSSFESLEHRLPDISLVDTRSFEDLFDQFKGQESLEDCSDAQPQLESEKASGKGLGQANVNINRTDSRTSSSYSQPSQRESDYSPIVTRHSSSSSYTQEPPFAISKSVTDQGPARPVLAGIDGSYPRAHGSRTTTNSSSLIVSSTPPNLDKPLPPGPSGGQKASTSAPTLPSRQTAAELPSEPIIPPQTQSEPNITHRAPSRSDGIATSDQVFQVAVISDLLSSSTNPVPAVGLGNAPSTSHRRHQSASETAYQQSMTFKDDHARRKSADLSLLASKVEGSTRLAKSRSKQLYRPITAATAERVIYRVMCNLQSIEDLLATAMVSKGFLRTFQRNQSNLVSHLLFKTSRPAWEFRRSMLALQGSKDFVLKDFRRDCARLTALKAHIAAHCRSSCKPSTLAGLLGEDTERQAEVDHALWRICTFSTLFGNTVGQSGASSTETDWLNGGRAPNNKRLGAGFSIGNGPGLSIPELENMKELWQSLQVIVSGFHGREEEAKQFGVFDNWHPEGTVSESQHLAEWISYLLALGPQTVLSVSSCSFERARTLGLTTWAAPPTGKSRCSFLVAAMTQVYQERVLEEATLKTTRFSVSRAPIHRPTRSVEERQLPFPPSSRPATSKTQPLRIDTSNTKRRPASVDEAGNSRLEIRPDCDPDHLEGHTSGIFPASPTADPTLFYALNMTSTASTKLGATLFPMDYARPTPRVPFPAPERPAVKSSGVIDPVDKAMTFLVQEMGFQESRARKALAMCDTGSGLDLQKAVELLAVDSKDSRQQFSAPVELPTSVEMPGPPSKLKQQHLSSFCDGQCKRTGTIVHSRSRSAGAITEVSISPVSAADGSEWQDTISPLAASPMSATRARTPMRRGPSRSTRTWKVLGMDTMLKRKTSLSVLGIDEYQAKVERKRSMRAVNGTSDPGVKDGLSKNLLGLGLAVGSGAGAKASGEQVEHVREKNRHKKEKSSASRMARYA
ncbi:hypothetical protein A1O1_08429 [Capronia coronata CBS 617.96]|uniref:UBA domain-containing protein n=1 Tax=Capronia coronata CBS 617.96 TaxID=1182541 RepID=W9XIE8_9EURO|nr:uncharacterized protein A1O1_08429 [Capronia coronata CBS 617.96]EXJ80287.1 hypothetical protein A1O1_08429 [Capronia coronata CBS 617.96]